MKIPNQYEAFQIIRKEKIPIRNPHYLVRGEFDDDTLS